uniref:Uncharacterized protein n=1 Tax=Ralstonia solanacearum CFBP2957 TaxID=859656 RepID=D8P455_RALSL|nr:protein of unknown function [Ralstonia solanacearum CFBP2957]
MIDSRPITMIGFASSANTTQSEVGNGMASVLDVLNALRNHPRRRRRNEYTHAERHDHRSNADGACLSPFIKFKRSTRCLKPKHAC